MITEPEAKVIVDKMWSRYKLWKLGHSLDDIEKDHLDNLIYRIQEDIMKSVSPEIDPLHENDPNVLGF